MPASYGYASVVTSRPEARASPISSSIAGVSARPALLMCTTCSGAWVSSASASASFRPATPGRMCTFSGVFVFAATRNTASSSSGGRGRVRKSRADVDRTLAQTSLDALRDLVNLGGRRGAIGSVAHRHPGARIVQHGHPDFDVADADAIVDALAGTALAVPGVDVRRAELELERRRHAVERVVAVGLGRLSVRVDINEAGRVDYASCVDRVMALDSVRRDDG